MDRSQPTADTRTLGRYRIEARIGEGAMADVYRAYDTGIGRVVAIKMLKTEFGRRGETGERFLQEARAAGTLNHPGIATIYDVGEVDGVAYIAMELVEGQQLDMALQSSGRMPFERVLHLGAQLADALGYAHRHGVVHRDVKPSNILLSADGSTVKLLDFGVARVREHDAERDAARTQAGQMIGTPRYMSPEQALGLAVDHRCDLFSLGVVLYEMVTGKVAFPGTALATLAIQIAQEKVEPVGRSAADCPPGLSFIIDKLLAKKPEQRFADAAQVLTALQREIAALGDGRAGRRGLPVRVKLPLVLALVTAVSLVFSITAVLGRERRTLEHMAYVSGASIAAFVTNNAAVLAAENAGMTADQQDWSALQAFVTTAARDQGVRDIRVADGDGIVRASTTAAEVGRRYTPVRREAVIAAGPGGSMTSVKVAGEDRGLRFVRPITYAGARFGTVDLVLRRDELDGALASARMLLIALASAVMAAVLLVGGLSAALVARPVRRMQQALDDAAQSGFALRISHRRRDEFGALFDTFNRVAAVIEPRLAGRPDTGERPVTETRIAPVAKRAA